MHPVIVGCIPGVLGKACQSFTKFVAEEGKCIGDGVALGVEGGGTKVVVRGSIE